MLASLVVDDVVCIGDFFFPQSQTDLLTAGRLWKVVERNIAHRFSSQFGASVHRD